MKTRVIPDLEERSGSVSAGEVEAWAARARERRADGKVVFWREAGGAGDPAWPFSFGGVVRRLPGAGRGGVGAALDRLWARIQDRRTRGGPGGTGVGLLLAFEALDSGPRRRGPGLPDLLAFEVDAAFVGSDCRWMARPGAPSDPPRDAPAHGRHRPPNQRTARADGTPRVRSSLPRASYEKAVGHILRHIRTGEVYQVNLCQMFQAPFHADAVDVFAALAETQQTGPRSFLFAHEDLAVVSVSPETFVDVSRDGWVETRPIKGTRRRGTCEEDDRRLAAELAHSEKDRAELLMIVDLERNDLGRVCRPGSVQVPVLAATETFSNVHHLVATVRGRLREDLHLRTLIEAVFPGGSVTGAPKLRALEILRGLEPVERSFYTGSFLWFDDDGTTQSSLMIRTALIRGESVWVGAGAGIVADSDPEKEWVETLDKIRPLAQVLDFEPERAI